ncbi:hypothetical protein Scep_004964 [Stephania cephalantha]|uniref:N-acetyltransferase domain-containing protein n=1 Tax=Stephania cephalantha TaxID=152367 RepID=A0AAP0KUB8_9MAGN
MGSVPLGLSASPPLFNNANNPNNNSLSLFNNKKSSSSSSSPVPSRLSSSPPLSNPSKSGVCKASQLAELFPSTCPEVVVREARLEDLWEVAETHCSSFFPDYSFPLDFVLRIDRLVSMLAGLSLPSGCRRTCLVASAGNKFIFGSEEFKFGEFEGKIGFGREHIVGILTVDTVADFLPRRGPLMQRRTGIAYISNVAVREGNRRKGIAKKLIVKAEAEARRWNCRAIALHCDINNPAAVQLYKGQGFKSIKVPERAKWPQPKSSPNTQFNFMMKLLTSPSPQ